MTGQSEFGALGRALPESPAPRPPPVHASFSIPPASCLPCNPGARMDRTATQIVGREKPIFLLHIPKTGGNTIVAQFLSFLPVEAVWPPPPGLVLDADGMKQAASRLSSLRFIH